MKSCSNTILIIIFKTYIFLLSNSRRRQQTTPQPENRKPDAGRPACCNGEHLRRSPGCHSQREASISSGRVKRQGRARGQLCHSQYFHGALKSRPNRIKSLIIQILNLSFIFHLSILNLFKFVTRQRRSRGHLCCCEYFHGAMYSLSCYNSLIIQQKILNLCLIFVCCISAGIEWIL